MLPQLLLLRASLDARFPNHCRWSYLLPPGLHPRGPEEVRGRLQVCKVLAQAGEDIQGARHVYPLLAGHLHHVRMHSQVLKVETKRRVRLVSPPRPPSATSALIRFARF